MSSSSSLSFNNNTSKEEEEKREKEREEYNAYILRDGIHEKIKAQIDKEYRIRLWDKIYTRTRQRIRQKGGMITHDAAMRAVIAEQGREILEEIYNEALDQNGYLKKNHPLLLENLRLDKDEKTRQEAIRMYRDIMKAFE